MIDLKKEIIKKQQINNEKVELYNSVINKYIPQIKDICNSNELKFEHYLDEKGLIELKFHSKNERTKYYFNYKCIERELKLNRLDDNTTIQIIENQLKAFILGITEKEDIIIKETPVRGKRRDAGIIEEDCNIDIEKTLQKFDKTTENNVYLSQKERNTIRVQIENVLQKFESYVDEHLYKNELESAKVDHNVVVCTRSILDKLNIADCNEGIEPKYK